MKTTMTTERANEIKQRLYQRGETLKSWAAANGFKY
ncbi:MAG: DNA-binding protein, partial [Betaproteobacteria bacterium]